MCVELPVQLLFLGICVNVGLTIYGRDTTDAYAHSPTPNNIYLQVDYTYAEWYNNKFKNKISKQMVLPVKHALQGHPKSRKMWMKVINDILISELGFKTTTHDRCIYIWEKDGEIQLLLYQVDDFMLGITSKKAAQDLFNDIGIKIQFPSETEANIISFEFLGVGKDYNGVNIIQIPDYIEMSSKSYIDWLLKLHGWDMMSPKSFPNENLALP